MKKRFKFLALLSCVVLCLGTLFGCDFGKPDGTPCTIMLVYNNGVGSLDTEAIAGEVFATPADPVKENYIFTGWYMNAGLTVKYDFSSEVKNDFTLYAGYVLDGAAITNAITTEGTIKGVVEIVRRPYVLRGNFIKQKKYSSTDGAIGSGFCFLIENGTYYVLTNCHVAYYDESTYDGADYYVTDYSGTTWTASLYRDSTLNGAAIDPAYDLAILSFTPDSGETPPDMVALDFAPDPQNGDDVIALGSPLGQNNAVTFGEVKEYTTINLQVDGNDDGVYDTNANESNVDFEVIMHTAYINHGSSGGALINPDLKVVGVNFAGSTNNETGNFSAGYAVSCSKVFEFLNTYFYSTPINLPT